MLGVILAARHPSHALLRAAIEQRTHIAIASLGENSGAWLRSHVPVMRQMAVMRAFTAAVADPAGDIMLSLVTASPVGAREVWQRTVERLAADGR